MAQEFKDDSFYDISQNKILKQVQLETSAVIAYVVGGGSLSEYETIKKLNDQIQKQIIYGCDYLYTGEEFVGELRKLHS